MQTAISGAHPAPLMFLLRIVNNRQPNGSRYKYKSIVNCSAYHPITCYRDRYESRLFLFMKVLLQRCLLPALAQQRKQHQHRLFHSTRQRDVVKPFLLADIGEGAGIFSTMKPVLSLTRYRYPRVPDNPVVCAARCKGGTVRQSVRSTVGQGCS